MKTKVIFICIHNSARSQMAEMFLNDIASDRFEAKSAGLEAGKLNPFVVKAMANVGIDMSANKTKTVMEILESGESFDYVITVCDKEAAERCPLFPGKGEKLHWGFEDPSSFQGTDEEKLAFAMKVRDQIKAQLESFLSSF
ncbi:MAG: arsenate reductase ArsC [Denitrovibrio sp.]|nr:MAG: arsenate reductase ArsC [Denitrovibrio sp.]